MRAIHFLNWGLHAIPDIGRRLAGERRLPQFAKVCAHGVHGRIGSGEEIQRLEKVRIVPAIGSGFIRVRKGLVWGG